MPRQTWPLSGRTVAITGGARGIDRRGTGVGLSVVTLSVVNTELGVRAAQGAADRAGRAGGRR